ncbi:MAG: glycosyltransferase family protein [Ignavibacteriaceae bacterium]|nr:glycosyltransferase family protein [Ignavibacteriaceae bacterium]
MIQARSGSSRLANKIFLTLTGKPLLYRMFERVAASELKGTIVIATTTESSDDNVESFCKDHKINFYRGHQTDLLDRHYQAAKIFSADAVIKIPSDCPLIDSKVIDKVIQFYLNNINNYDYVSNLHPATYPDGNDVEIMSFNALEKAWNNAEREFEREHTTPFIWENPDKFRIGNVLWETGLDYSMTYRFTIDYPEDYEFIKKVYDELYPKKPDFSLEDILNLLNENKEIKKINSKYNGVNWYRNHLNELKTITSNQTKIL